MTCRKILLIGSLIFGMGIPVFATGSKGSKKGAPNIILFIADDMYKHMFNRLPEGQGENHNYTPVLDKLQDEGTIMMQQHVSSPVCQPSRYSLMTGKYASRARNKDFVNHAMTEYPDVTPVGFNVFVVDGEATLPRYLQAGGYTTGFVGKNHIFETEKIQWIKRSRSAREPRVIKILKSNYQILQKAFLRGGFDYAERLSLHNPSGNGPKDISVHNLDWITEGALNFIDQNKDTPFFLTYAATIPHGPTKAKMSWDADPLATPLGFLKKAPKVQPARHTLKERIDKAEINRKGKWWGPENLLWLDDSMGAIMKRLQKHKIDDNTIVIFFNDHGQNAKGTTYQGGVHDPSVIWKKGGFKAGGQSQAMVSGIDIAPTILDMAGIAAPKGAFDGRSFLPALNGKKFEDKPMLFEMGYSRAVRKGKWKYIALRYPKAALSMSLKERKERLDKYNAWHLSQGDKAHNTDPKAPFSHLSLIPGGGGAERWTTPKYPAFHDADQLYDLSADPNEQKNLAQNPKYAKILKDMKRELKVLLADNQANFAEFTR